LANVDSFESEIPLEHLDILLDYGIEFGFDPTSSVEMESYFAKLILTYSGSQNDLHSWLGANIKETFRCVGKKPEWIQNPNWCIEAGRPMWFVGQINIPVESGVFHDDASFYIFWNPETGSVKGVIQVS
jgi:hypothetical protein